MEQLLKAKSYLVSRGIKQPEVGVVLGTGLNQFIQHVRVIHSIPYSEIPHFPVSTVDFHKGNFIYGEIEDRLVVIMQGRFHAYEGYTMQEIVFPIRVMKLLGIEKLFLSNAAGGINPDLRKGDLVLIDDHINLQWGNPLTGTNRDELGPRFPDMSEPYNQAISDRLKREAVKMGIVLKTGVYAAVTGPNLETRAEYRYLRTIGADMVGMSTVPEVIAANHMQLPCAAISVITDECDPDHLQPVNIREIIEVAAKADEKFSRILDASIRSL